MSCCNSSSSSIVSSSSPSTSVRSGLCCNKETNSLIGENNYSTRKSNHLVLLLGNAVTRAYSTSTFAVQHIREQSLSSEIELRCASSTAFHCCQRRTFDRLYPYLVPELIDTMPNVTKLEVICAAINLDDSELDNECLRALESLIQHWSPTLITLRLWFQFEPNDYQHLLRTINTLTSIRYLTLEVVAKNSIEDTMEEEEEDGKTSEPCECISKLDDEFDLPLLSRLEEFYYHPTNLSESFFKTLTKYVTFPDSPLNRIGIRTERGITENDMGQFFALSTELSTRFIHVPHIRRPFNPESLTKFFNHCNALTSVDLDAASLSLEQLVISLSPLTSLLWLRLTNAFSRLGRTISTEDRNPMPTQLNSVRGLMVELLATKHTVLQSIHWPFIFPSLTELTVINRTGICSMCSRAAHLGLTKDTSQQRLDCIRYLMEPFRKCPQLQRSFPVNILETSSTNEQGNNNSDFSTMISKNT